MSVPTTAVAAAAGSVMAAPEASCAAGVERPLGPQRPAAGTTDARLITTRPTNPIPAAAVVEAVAADARNVTPAHASSASHESTPRPSQPATGSGPNSTAVYAHAAAVAASTDSPRTTAIATSLAARNAPRVAGCASTSAAVPRSSSPDTLPIASAIAASAPS